jgi:NNP family nitrate/nitrite transporter-like MFS transporter
MVGVLGGLGGFFCPIIFGYLLETTGLWTSCWMFMFLVSLVCLVWMHLVVSRMKAESPEYEAVRKLPGDFEVGGEMAPVEVRS